MDDDREYNVCFVCFNGMSYDLKEQIDRATLETYLRSYFQRKRAAGYSVTKLDKPGQWEVQLEDAGMIGDSDGYLVVKRHRPARRRR